MKFFNIFSKENRDSKDTKPIQNKEGKDVAKSNRGHQSAIKGYENTIAENKKLKAAFKIKKDQARELRRKAFRHNIMNLTSFEKTDGKEIKEEIDRKYAKEMTALNLSSDQLKKLNGSKKVIRKENHEARKNIRLQKRKIASNNRQAFLTKSLREGRKVGLFALGVITSPAKYATDGIVQGAKVANDKVIQPVRTFAIDKAKDFKEKAETVYNGGVDLGRKLVRNISAKVDSARQAVGDTITSCKKTAIMVRGRYAEGVLKRQQNRQTKLQRWANAATGNNVPTR